MAVGGGLCAGTAIYGATMRTELPPEHLRRRLGSHPDADADADPDAIAEADGDPNSLLPRWIPDAASGAGWLARLRADPGRTGAVALAVVAAIAVLITVFTVVRNQPEPVVSAKLPAVAKVSFTNPRSSASPNASPSAAADQPVVVSVVGLVHTPGLVTLAPGSRIADAVKAAGGAMAGADTIGLNMARQVGDGEQIVVGLAPLARQPAVLGSSVGSGPVPAGQPGAALAPVGSNPAKPAVIDLNTATPQQLDDLPGVGPITAAAIVAWRAANGRFTSVDQLADVDGIGPARLEKLRALVHV